MHTHPGTQAAASLLKKFPNAHSKTIARILYKESPELYTDLEAARDAVRRLRGAHGEFNRARYRSKEFFKPLGKLGDPFALPLGKTHFVDWKAVQFDGPMRVLILSDIHIPYQDKDALLLAIKWGKNNGINHVLLNGDTSDFFALSFWETDPRLRDFPEEIKVNREFLISLRNTFPRARIILKDGNHEERWMRYMRVKAPELLGIPEFEPPKVLGLASLGIDNPVGDMRPIRLGTLNVIHGHEYRFSISNPVNPARGLFLRAKAHSLCGHFHHSSYHPGKTVEDKMIGCWSTGCLCDMHPAFRPLNEWNHGFAYVEVDRVGKFEVHNFQIKSNKVYPA